MLTRLEIDGFKSFEEFAVDLGPYAVILGANGVGKSNLFDALRLLTGLAAGPVYEAVRDLRGRPDELFSFDAVGRPRRTMRLAVEVLVPPTLVDPFEARVELTNTRLRYEVELSRGENGNGVGELLVARESASRISAKGDRWLPGGHSPSRAFKDTCIHRTNRLVPFLHTEGGEFHMHQDGSAGRTRRLPASRAHATALSTVTSAVEFPHLHALRAELASWRFLHLDPTSVRDPFRTSWAVQLEPDGRNLGRVLDRIRERNARPARGPARRDRSRSAVPREWGHGAPGRARRGIPGLPDPVVPRRPPGPVLEPPRLGWDPAGAGLVHHLQ